MMRISKPAALARFMRWTAVAMTLAAAGTLPSFSGNGVRLATAVAADAPAETLPDGVKVTSLEAYPTTLELRSRFDYRQLLVLGRTAEGELVDLTRGWSR
jgi:hypothetical protein